MKQVISNEIKVIVGPTSSGKTSLAIKIAKEQGNTSIVSADSRQIYKHMDIGTGKVPVDASYPWEKKADKYVLNGIDVWGYDLALPDEPFTAVDYAKYALTKMRELLNSGERVLLVGGTGFYIDVVCKRIVLDLGEPDLELRNTLEKQALKDLVKKLTSLNPEVTFSIDLKNKVRVVRAIERELNNSNPPTLLPYLTNVNFEFLGLTFDRDILYKRADLWLEQIWENGLIDETQKLLSMGFENSRPLRGLIYKSVVSCLNGELTEKEAKQRCKFDLHAYIRRQQTWFKRNNEIEWSGTNTL
ncbi:MAG: tRNA (adenosine(37)-N6)-dimethylallyltransferase [Patescibacteria group bacterium]